MIFTAPARQHFNSTLRLTFWIKNKAIVHGADWSMVLFCLLFRIKFDWFNCYLFQSSYPQSHQTPLASFCHRTDEQPSCLWDAGRDRVQCSCQFTFIIRIETSHAFKKGTFGITWYLESLGLTATAVSPSMVSIRVVATTTSSSEREHQKPSHF